MAEHQLLHLGGAGGASHILSDPYDPILNTSILWWNATTLPFSADWWNPPFFYPSRDVSAFTENLVGIGPVSTPLYWLTRDPIATHNIAMFLTWPLSAFAVFVLVAWLTRRADAAFLAAVAGLFYSIFPRRATGVDQATAFIAFRAFPAVIIGGLDSIPGAVVGGFAVGIAESAANTYLTFDFLGNGFPGIVGYLLMMVVLLIRPYGLMGTPEIRRV